MNATASPRTHRRTSTRQDRQIRKVQEIVASFYGVSVDQMTESRGKEPMATIRQVAMYLARKETEASYPDLAHAFKKDHHGTIMHAMRAIEAKRSVTPD